VPSLPSKKSVRKAIERAWFEAQPLHMTYVHGSFVESTRDIRIVSVVMDRHETRIDAVRLDNGERRHYRIERAEVVRIAPSGS